MGSISSQRKISLFPEGSHEAGPCTHKAEFAPGLGAKFSQIARAKVGQALPLQMTPEVFHRVELRCVSGQLGEVDPPWMSLKVGFHLPAPVHREAVPDDKQRPADLASESSEELRGLRTPDRSLVKPEVEFPPSDRGDHTEVVPSEAELELRSLAQRGPSTDHRRSFAQAGFVDEDDGSAFGCGLFFKAGQVCRFHRVMAASSRWVARFSGFWTLQPNWISTRHRCPGWMRRPVSRSSTAAILGSVQRSLVKPWVCAPSTRKRPKALRWDSLILGGCPRGRRFQAPLPLASRARRQRSAVGVETSHRRATSACVTPRANSPMPFFRRASMASRLRLVGRGFRSSDLVTSMS